MKKFIRWGIIGTGDVSEKKSGPALYQAQKSSLNAVMNRTLEKAVDFAGRHGNPTVHESAEELVRDEGIDAVYIGTAPDSHLMFTRLAAEHGKHVFCEKPMARTVAECELMINLCREAEVSLTVAFYRRYFPVVQKLKELVDGGAIGKVLHITATTIVPFHLPMDAWRLNANVSGGGFLMDMGVHRFDLFAYLCGPPREVSGFASNQEWQVNVENSASVSIEFENGVLGTAIFHWNSSAHRDTLSLVGTDGIIQVEDLSGQGKLVLDSQKTQESWKLPSKAPVHLELVNRLNAHLLEGSPNPCPGESAIYANKMAGALVKSSSADDR